MLGRRRCCWLPIVCCSKQDDRATDCYKLVWVAFLNWLMRLDFSAW